MLIVAAMFAMQPVCNATWATHVLCLDQNIRNKVSGFCSCFLDFEDYRKLVRYLVRVSWLGS
jgi:hypothetical protein